MRERKASRLLVINPSQEVLLFRFVHKDGPLAGQMRLRSWRIIVGGLPMRCALPKRQSGRNH